MHGELFRPLGLEPISTEPRRRLSGPSLVAAVAAIGLAAASFVIAFDREDLFSGREGEHSEPALEEVAAAPRALEKSAPVENHNAASSAVAPLDLPPIPPGGVSFRVEDPGSLRQAPSVAHIPEPDLVEDSPYGPLPIRAPDGRRPFDVYAGPPGSAGGTRIAIVVGGLGISQSGSQNAVETLPADITLGFSPAGNSLDRWMRDARRLGHELVLQIPMEPAGYPQINPGDNTLTVSDATAGVFDKLEASLARLTNYVGVMNYMGGRLTADEAAMSGFLSELHRRGLMYFDDGSSIGQTATDAAILANVPSASADVIVDRSTNAEDIRRQLDVLERIARAEGSAIGVASAFDTSISTIAQWVQEAEGRGIDIVPLSALAYDPEGYR